MSEQRISRRGLVRGMAGLGAVSLLSGCDALVGDISVDRAVRFIEASLTQGAQRLLLSRGQLAREFTEADLSPDFKVNGTAMPGGEAYARLLDGGFSKWRLVVDGKVARRLELSLADLKRLPARTQITRHDCVEGWSAIGKWTGVPLAAVLNLAGPTTAARYVVFHCADEYEPTTDGTGQYYESINLIDAYHPQTILAYAMNGADLSVGHGAPLRLRVERQLGYKHAKFIMRIELVESFVAIGRGKGGFWEDRGYEWYAGI